MSPEHTHEPFSPWKRILPISIVIVLGTLIYTILRYNIFGTVLWMNFPLYVVNKAVALSSVILIGISYALGNLNRLFPYTFSRKLTLRRQFGLLGFGLAGIHSLMSIALLRPAYYPKFYFNYKFSLVGELTLLFGVLALFIFSLVALSSFPSVEKSMDHDKWKSIQRLGYWAYLLVMFHVFTMGIQSWLRPDLWPRGLLPISLIAFIVIFTVIYIKLVVVFVNAVRKK